MNQIIARSILITFLASIHNKIKIPKSQRLRSKLVQLQKGSAVQRWNQSSKNTKYYSLNVHGLLITRKSQIFFAFFGLFITLLLQQITLILPLGLFFFYSHCLLVSILKNAHGRSTIY